MFLSGNLRINNLLLSLWRLLVVCWLVLILGLVWLSCSGLSVLGRIHMSLLNRLLFCLILGWVLDRNISSVGNFLLSTLRTIFILDFFLHLIHDPIHNLDVFAIRYIRNRLMGSWLNLNLRLSLDLLNLWLIRCWLLLFINLLVLSSYLLYRLWLDLLNIMNLGLVINLRLLHNRSLLKVSMMILLLKISILMGIEICHIIVIPHCVLVIVQVASWLRHWNFLIRVTYILFHILTDRFKMTFSIILIFKITLSIVTIILVILLLIIVLNLLIKILGEVVLTALALHLLIKKIILQFIEKFTNILILRHHSFKYLKVNPFFFLNF
jgi:hypothetical protein